MNPEPIFPNFKNCFSQLFFVASFSPIFLKNGKQLCQKSCARSQSRKASIFNRFKSIRMTELKELWKTGLLEKHAGLPTSQTLRISCVKPLVVQWSQFFINSNNLVIFKIIEISWQVFRWKFFCKWRLIITGTIILQIYSLSVPLIIYVLLQSKCD